MTVAIDKEAFTPALYEEIVPLGRKCWAESTVSKAETCAFYGERDFRIEPDFATYQRLTDQGAVLIVTLRDEGALVGYAVGFVYRSWHHNKIMCGATDTFYVEPDYRAYAAVMAAKFEEEFWTLGAQIIGWPTHANGPIYELLKARGYVGDDVVMEKRICVS